MNYPYQQYQQYGTGYGPYQQQYQQQGMTPPTIRAEIIQVASEEEVDRWPLAAGQSQMFITRDELHFLVKTQHQNGEYDKDVYDKRPPAPPAPVFQPGDYVRKDELNALLAAALESRGGQHEPV